jgi:hypothetical protein
MSNPKDGERTLPELDKYSALHEIMSRGVVYE